MKQSDNYELIAKRCPSCESLIMARTLEVSPGISKYDHDYKCSTCQWTSVVTTDSPGNKA